MAPSSECARQITDDLLDKSGRAFLTGDFQLFQSCIELPYEIETFDGKRLVKTPEQLRDVFDGVRTHHRNTNVSQMDRHVLESVFKDEDTILSTFETRLLNGDLLTQAPYPVFAVLVRNGDQWKTNSMTFAIEDRPSHNAILLGQTRCETKSHQTS